jgi:hypothetical protein
VGLAGIATARAAGFDGAAAAGALATGFGTGAGAGLAAGFAAGRWWLGAGLAFTTTTGFFAGAAFLAESAFLAMVFLAFVAFAGFLAAILRSLPGVARSGPLRTADLKEGRDYTDGAWPVQDNAKESG